MFARILFKAVYVRNIIILAFAFHCMDDALHIYCCVDSGTFADLKVHG